MKWWSDEVLIDIFLFHRLQSYFWNFFARAARKPEGKHMTIDEATVSHPMLFTVLFFFDLNSTLNLVTEWVPKLGWASS